LKRKKSFKWIGDTEAFIETLFATNLSPQIRFADLFENWCWSYKFYKLLCWFKST